MKTPNFLDNFVNFVMRRPDQFQPQEGDGTIELRDDKDIGSGLIRSDIGDIGSDPIGFDIGDIRSNPIGSDIIDIGYYLIRSDNIGSDPIGSLLTSDRIQSDLISLASDLIRSDLIILVSDPIRSDPISRVGLEPQAKLPSTLSKVCPRCGHLESSSFE